MLEDFLVLNPVYCDKYCQKAVNGADLLEITSYSFKRDVKWTKYICRLALAALLWNYLHKVRKYDVPLKEKFGTLLE